VDELLARQMPYSMEAEQAVLGAIFIDPNIFGQIVELISAEDFYFEANKQVFETISHMYTEGKTIDPVTAIDEMKVLGYKDNAKREFFMQLIGPTVSAVNATAYAEIVRGKSMLRKLINAAGEITEMALKEQDDPARVAEVAEQKIYAIRQGREIKGLTPIRNAIQLVFDNLDMLAENPGQLPGLPTGFSGLDDVIGGFNPSDLIILASRPGMGKTSIVLNMALEAAIRSKKKVVIFQLEMSAEQLASRLLSSRAQVDSRKLRMGKLDDNDWDELTEAARFLRDTGIMIDDNSGITVPEMKAKCRRLGSELGMIVVDYLQLMQSPKHIENRVQEVAEISRGLKIMAKELNVPVVCCSQLSRGPEGRQVKKPMLSDLRESGSIEQDADIVMFIYREDYYNKETANKNTAELIVAKNRHGELKTIELQWEGQYTRFSTPDNVHTEP